MKTEEKKTPGAAKGAPEGTEGATGAAHGVPRRWSAPRKQEVVLRLLRGETLDSLSREFAEPAAKIARWRDAFLAGGAAALKSRDGDARDDEIKRLHGKVGEQTMEIELLNGKIDRMEAGGPFVSRRPRR